MNIVRRRAVVGGDVVRIRRTVAGSIGVAERAVVDVIPEQRKIRAQPRVHVYENLILVEHAGGFIFVNIALAGDRPHAAARHFGIVGSRKRCVDVVFQQQMIAVRVHVVHGERREFP